MSEFKYRFYDNIKAVVPDGYRVGKNGLRNRSIEVEGTIVGKDVNFSNNVYYYLIALSESNGFSTSLAYACKQIFSNGTVKFADNIRYFDKGCVFTWVNQLWITEIIRPCNNPSKDDLSKR